MVLKDMTFETRAPRLAPCTECTESSCIGHAIMRPTEPCGMLTIEIVTWDASDVQRVLDLLNSTSMVLSVNRLDQ